ncbi:hypothetical protein CTAYLR_005555 [Chrysophaeum taylorii]|uniref:peptidylprolyl isomerase n=1 Tax=Chrysophaeum taylorii TaxID=2483200 RepID=A0AAD7XLQ4_9STRA|nr:hypothetical protein CTAYLR_005555 [Chrysophaeum taylorii]
MLMWCSAAALTIPRRVLPSLAISGQLEELGMQTPGGEAPFETLETGVKIKTLRVGDGPVVRADSTVALRVTGRLLNLNGVKFYATGDDLLEELRVGVQDLVPGLAEGIVGARRGEIRRVVVPAARGYSDPPLREPLPTGLGLNALNSVLKNPRRDASLLFDVKILRIK